MPYFVQQNEGSLILELKGGVTARDVGELAKCVAASLTSGAGVVVRAQDLEDVDTSVLQMLVSLRKTAVAFRLENPSEAFLNAMDRCSLRRDLVAGKDAP
jgi:anti-anti-sigma regulatory factor